MSGPISIALGVELPADILERLRQISPRLELWTAAQLERDPSGYQQAELALVAGWLDTTPLREARRLRWLQTVGAGVARRAGAGGAASRSLLRQRGPGRHRRHGRAGGGAPLGTARRSWAQLDYFQHLGELFIQNLQRYVAGQPLLNVVDKHAGY
ncbi:MAG: hypothetical protein RL033_5002 [Pseudomonadota bacterium]